jgi:dTDP-4-dehydrorhamnose 3,5-epimerase
MILDVQPTAIPDVKILVPKRFGDGRGFFSETYSKRSFTEAGLHYEFVQDNHSLSERAGTLRGLHFQVKPFEQSKLIRVTRGSIFDVVLDLRRSSPTFGRHVAVEISASNWRQILVPVGFAHGFCSLEPNTEVLYKVTNYYSPAHDRGVAFDDPALGIEWPVSSADVILSEKDRNLPRLAELPAYFY